MIKYNKILITGAASGLGKSLAKSLNKLNKKLILLDKNFDGLNSLKNELNTNSNLKIINFDLSKKDLIHDLFEKELKNETDIDCLVNCAAYEAAGFFDDIPTEEMLKNIDTNAISPILLTKKILPFLIKNSGAVVNMISTMSTVGVPGRMSYCISKSALKSFSDVLRCELKYQNVQVLTVYPEVMSTPFWENVLYFGRIKNAMFNDPRKKNDPKKIAKGILKALEKNKFFYWQYSFTNLFSIFHFIFTNLGDKIVDFVCNIKNSNIKPLGCVTGQN